MDKIDKPCPAIVVIAKIPVAGKVKTRLYPSLSMEECSELYACFLQDTLNTVEALHGVKKYLALDLSDHGLSRSNRVRPFGVPDSFAVLDQGGGDLTDRLTRLTEIVLQNAACALFIGADSPDLPGSYLERAFGLLRDNDMVIGPSKDGGYYLIGLTGKHSLVFEDIQWSTDKVFKQTLGAAAKAGLKVEVLPIWPDVDTIDDLRELRLKLKQQPLSAPLTSAYLESHPFFKRL